MTNETRFEHRMLINGKLVEGRGGAFANINPATEELLGEVSDASCEDMAAAIDAARDAVVLKPAPDTPFNATRLGRLIAEHTDTPAEVVKIVMASTDVIPSQRNSWELSRPPAPRWPV